jgi:hypothetical protein
MTIGGQPAGCVLVRAGCARVGVSEGEESVESAPLTLRTRCRIASRIEMELRADVVPKVRGATRARGDATGRRRNNRLPCAGWVRHLPGTRPDAPFPC